MDEIAKPGDVIVFTDRSLLRIHGDQELTVIEAPPEHNSNECCGDCPWVELDGSCYYVQHDYYKIVRRGTPRTTIVGNDVDASLEKQRNDQLRDFFGFS